RGHDGDDGPDEGGPVAEADPANGPGRTDQGGPAHRNRGGAAVKRTLLLLVAFAGPAAWAGAQHGPNAAVPLDMLVKNRTTIGLLIDSGLDLGQKDDPVERVNASRQAAEAVRLALADAAGTQDVDRVVELGEHLSRLYRDGLVKTLDAATHDVPEGSPAMADLKVARERAVTNATAAAALPFAAGRLGGSARGMGMTGALTAAVQAVKAAAEPKK